MRISGFAFMIWLTGALALLLFGFYALVLWRVFSFFG